MRAAWVLVGLSATACLPSTMRYQSDLSQATQYSPGDGMVVAAVRSSTSSINASSIMVVLQNVELDYLVAYRTGAHVVLVEPGRYRVWELRVGLDVATMQRESFTVHSGEVLVLPPLVADVQDGHKILRQDPDPASARDAFMQQFPTSPWLRRPWTRVLDIGGATFALQPPPPRPQPWYARSPGASHYHHRTFGGTGGGRSTPSSGRRSPR